MTENPKLTEKMLVFLYCISQLEFKVNINTFRRYVYLYYILATPLSIAAFFTASATVFPTRGSKALGMM